VLLYINAAGLPVVMAAEGFNCEIHIELAAGQLIICRADEGASEGDEAK
jgi:hypothetical protein